MTHVSCGRIRQNVLRELKEYEILVVKLIPGPTDDEDLHTKSLAAADFEKHVAVYAGKDEYSGMN